MAFLLNLYLFIYFYVYECFTAYMSVCHMSGAHKGPKRAWDFSGTVVVDGCGAGK